MTFEFRQTVAFEYQRTIHLADTDALGIVYFSNGLVFCHEAYEASLEAMGIDVRTFFAQSSVAVPVVHAEIDFRLPLHCRATITIQLSPQLLDSHSFEISYRMTNTEGRLVATGLTRHVCLEHISRQRCALLPELTRWLQQFSDAVHHLNQYEPQELVYTEMNGQDNGQGTATLVAP